MQLASTSTPRSATSSVTCSYDSGYRGYQRTHKTITSPGYWRPLNGLCELIGMDFYPIRMPAPKFATKPVEIYDRSCCLHRAAQRPGIPGCEKATSTRAGTNTAR